MTMDIAAALAMEPVSSMLRIATDAGTVSGEYRKITADVVVIALTKKKILISMIAGRHTGTVTRQKVLKNGTLSDDEMASNSRSICFRAVTAIRWLTG